MQSLLRYVRFIAILSLTCIATLKQTNQKKKKNSEMLHHFIFYFRSVEDFVLHIHHCALMRIHKRNTF